MPSERGGSSAADRVLSKTTRIETIGLKLKKAPPRRPTESYPRQQGLKHLVTVLTAMQSQGRPSPIQDNKD